LLQGFKAFWGKDAEELLDQTMNRVDKDGSGEIEYFEWILVTIDKRSLLSEEKLKAAFDLFDDDGSGSISPDEIK
jgi:calcium-dependent protein kinase